MTKYLNKILEFTYQIKNKIAFYPSLFGIFGSLFAFLMIYVESQGVSAYLSENAPVLVVNDVVTARSLLTTFIGGLISIMVFSFSMVMILLNQASSNFSPRVLPGLISDRKHQIILGIYIATLLYCIFTLVSIEPTGSTYQLPGFSVLLAIFGMTCCLAAFVFFIHSISQAIQINNILDRIHETAKQRLIDLLKKEDDLGEAFPETSNWHIVKSPHYGYFQDFNLESLITLLEKNDVKLEILILKGTYVFEGSPLLKLNKKPSEDLQEDLLSVFHFAKNELVKDNYLLAFKQISEVAIKAMSPGINDPGTALNAIDYLTELFALRLRKMDKQIILNENKEPILNVTTNAFEDLLYQVMAALRTYCKHDPIIIQKLFMMLHFLRNSKDLKVASYKEALDIEIEALYKDAMETLKNEADRSRVEKMYRLDI